MPVDFSAYKRWQLQHRPSSIEAPSSRTNGTSTDVQSFNDPVATTVNTTSPAAPYPPTFSQIVDLITNGQPIPGIKEIPDTVLAGQETKPTTAKRKKPWEKANAEAGGGQVTEGPTEAVA